MFSNVWTSLWYMCVHRCVNISVKYVCSFISVKSVSSSVRNMCVHQCVNLSVKSVWTLKISTTRVNIRTLRLPYEQNYSEVHTTPITHKSFRFTPPNPALSTTPTKITTVYSPSRCLSLYNLQTHKRFKRTLIYYDVDNTMHIFRETPFFGPQNDT